MNEFFIQCWPTVSVEIVVFPHHLTVIRNERDGRFFVKALRDLNLLGGLKIDEPFNRLFNQGMLHGDDGFVMSKSRGNVVLPEEISKEYGIDSARFFLVSIASPNKDIQWGCVLALSK